MAKKPDEPAMTAYEAIRAHELMLNEAVSRFEHARLAPLIALNGGAMVAFLTLLGALLGNDSGRRPDLWLSVFAAGAWVVGLVAAALAITSAASRQAAISAAHRLLREGLEDALSEHVAKLLRGPVPTVQPPPPSALTHAINRTNAAWKRITRSRTERRKEKGKGTTSDTNDGPTPDTTAGAAETRDKGAAEKALDWPETKSERDEKRAAKRTELRDTAREHEQRFKARWWLSVAMFVTGAALSLAAILRGGSLEVSARRRGNPPRAAAENRASGPILRAATRRRWPYPASRSRTP